MILSDGTIREYLANGTIQMVPLEDNQIQPASIDFRLSNRLLVFESHRVGAVDPYNIPDDLHREVIIEPDRPFILHPGMFVLGSSLEAIGLGNNVVARCEGKSSLGRLGILVTATAGFVDAGWNLGQITLELSNVSPFPVMLHAGMKIGQFCFEMLDKPALRPYGHPELNSKYVGQSGPVGSRYTGNRPTPITS